MNIDRRATGRGGEEEAARFLAARGMIRLASNFFSRTGEMDLVMRDGKTLVFVEVKRRFGGSFGDGEDAVTDGKRRRIFNAAAAFVQRNGRWDEEIRFDVVVLQGGRARHYPSAFVPDAGLTYY